MANWCSNWVMFFGEQSSLEQVGTLFGQLAEKEEIENCGQLPGFITEDDNWFFDIRWEQGALQYDTRWVPNTAAVKDVADHFGLGFFYQYMETGNLIFGEATYENGVLRDVFLEEEDFRLFEYDDERDTYAFENDSYDSYTDLLEILLERRKNIQSLLS
jgi:hypothetical protein